MTEALGKVYQPGEDIVTEGEIGECMYVIQQGTAEVIRTESGVPTVVDTIHAGELFGEMATGFADVQPALSKCPAGLCQAPGKPHSSFHGTTLLKIDEDLPMASPQLGSENFFGQFSVLRTRAGRYGSAPTESMGQPYRNNDE